MTNIAQKHLKKISHPDSELIVLKFFTQYISMPRVSKKIHPLFGILFFLAMRF